MKYYQVNQRETFHREFTQGYLCCPQGKWGGWPLMQQLRTGDIIFHYHSPSRAVVGVSCIVNIGHHKGSTSSYPSAIEGTQCLRYQGQHLSEADFGPRRRLHLRETYLTYNEVHTEPILKRPLRKLLGKTPQAYLVAIDERVAERFVSDCGIRL